eukprot:12408671-Alexandrium_andersonii.AAC.1
MRNAVSCEFKGPSVTGGGASFTLQGGGCRRPQPVGRGSNARKNANEFPATRWKPAEPGGRDFLP